MSNWFIQIKRSKAKKKRETKMKIKKKENRIAEDFLWYFNTALIYYWWRYPFKFFFFFFDFVYSVEENWIFLFLNILDRKATHDMLTWSGWFAIYIFYDWIFFLLFYLYLWFENDSIGSFSIDKFSICKLKYMFDDWSFKDNFEIIRKESYQP